MLYGNFGHFSPVEMGGGGVLKHPSHPLRYGPVTCFSVCQSYRLTFARPV